MSGQNPWDERYQGPAFVYGREPNVWLKEQQARFPTQGHALAVADGEGRNGVWLAQQGLHVLAVDGSPVGLAKASVLAAERGCAHRYQTQVVDLVLWEAPAGAFDVIAQIYLHLPEAARRVVHGRLVRALRPGGLLVLECFTPRQLAFGTGGPKDLALLYEPEALREDFVGLEILHLAECEVELHEGSLHEGRGAVVRVLARARA